MSKAKAQVTHETEGSTIYLKLGDKRVVSIQDGGVLECAPEYKKQAAKFATYCRQHNIAYTSRNSHIEKQKPAPKVEEILQDGEKEAELAAIKAENEALKKQLSQQETPDLPRGAKLASKALNRDGISFRGNDTIYPGLDIMDSGLGVKCPKWQEWCKKNHPDLLEDLKAADRI